MLAYGLIYISFQAKGIWRELTDSVNAMADNLTLQVRSIAEITAAVAHGDFNRKVRINCSGEVLALKNTINKMVSRLQNFATEITKVTRYAQFMWFKASVSS